jgi:hypothetical protein
MYAKLLDRDLSFAQIARLTDRQIVDLLGHRRDERGEITPKEPSAAPDGPAGTMEADRLALYQAAFLGVPREKLEELWQSKYPGEPFLPDG